MSDDTARWCVLIPCSKREYWAVPQNCLAEIVTLHGDAGEPPEELSWRGELVPVLDFGGDEGPAWREQLGGSGLVAIFLGLEGEGCDYWGLAVRGDGLAVRQIASDAVQDVPDAALEYAAAAFRLEGEVYQVPDMLLLQRKIATSLEVA
jgi:hypothetical protein